MYIIYNISIIYNLYNTLIFWLIEYLVNHIDGLVFSLHRYQIENWKSIFFSGTDRLAKQCSPLLSYVKCINIL